jgi:UDP-N-acetylenolpyruvoylglucosamine reductase
MSRVPSLPFRVVVQPKAHQGGSLPPAETHTFENMATAFAYRDEAIKKPRTRVVTVLMVLDEATPLSNQQAIEKIEKQREAHRARIAARGKT